MTWQHGHARWVPLAAILPVLAVTGCGPSYANKITVEATSPNGHWKAIAFVRHCTLKTRGCLNINYVSILDASQVLPNTKGNALSIDNGGRLAVNSTGEIELRLEWKRDDLLIVWYPGPARILSQQNALGAVHIVYQPVGFL